jgi:hypothetical protein
VAARKFFRKTSGWLAAVPPFAEPFCLSSQARFAMRKARWRESTSNRSPWKPRPQQHHLKFFI